VQQDRGRNPSLNHLVGKREQLIRHGEGERLCSLEINRQLEFGRLGDREVGGFGALEDATGIDAGLARRVQDRTGRGGVLWNGQAAEDPADRTAQKAVMSRSAAKSNYSRQVRLGSIARITAPQHCCPLYPNQRTSVRGAIRPVRLDAWPSVVSTLTHVNAPPPPVPPAR
jgi:hypothetical protein